MYRVHCRQNKSTFAPFFFLKKKKDGPGSSPHILKIYAQPYVTPEPIKPLPPWFKTILLGLSPMYHNFIQEVGELEDWASRLTYRGSATRMLSSRKLTMRSRNGRHVQRPLHMLISYAKAVWKLHMPLINWEHLRTWVPSVPKHNLLTGDAASHPPLCVVATI